MSIIVVVKKAEKVVIASDTSSKLGNIKVVHSYIHQPSKILKFNDAFIGLVGAGVHENVLRHLFERYKDDIFLGSKQEIFDTYLRIHPILKDEYFINTSEDNDNTYESSQISALIANSNGIFGMYSWREVYEYEKFWALGSGIEFALGSLFSTYDLLDDPKQIAETAIKAACEFDDGCGLPLEIHSVILESDKTESAMKSKRKK